ncbi:MAG: cytidylate kinase-like family protein [Clostridia bacterium]|nr:cytidylate kinase-like family protein [Clostridia bacterium]
MGIVITVSRQFGSGGRAIGKLVAEKLGIPFYNKEIIDMAAEKLGYAKEFVKANEQKMKVSSVFSLAAMTSGSGGSENFESKIFNMESKVIEEIASEGPCVIVGRCANYVLKKKAQCLNVFVHADMDARIDRIINVYKLHDDRKTVEKMIKDNDKKRARYYKYHTEQEWGDSNSYDISVSTSAFGIEAAADIVVEAYKKLAE